MHCTIDGCDHIDRLIKAWWTFSSNCWTKAKWPLTVLESDLLAS